MTDQPVIVIGAGLAGLCCARVLTRAGVACTVLEAADAVGGRVRTDRHEGFLLDRGFQVFLTAYPEARRVLDYGALDLRPFLAGALVRAEGELRRIVDPWKRPVDGARSILSAVISVGDVVPLTKLRLSAARSSAEVNDGPDSLWSLPEETTQQALRSAGVSQRAIDRFFRPFFGGVFFDRELSTSSRMFRFTFKMFADGEATLPAAGMQAIPEQIAALLGDRTTLRLRSPVHSIAPDGTGVLTSGREQIPAAAVVVASDGAEAQRLIGDDEAQGGVQFRGWRSTATLYFAAEKPPVDDPILVLDGDGRGPVNHLCVPSQVAPSYAPAGAALISANIVGEPDSGWAGVTTATLDQLRGWFGSQVDRWRHLRTYRIPHALPSQPVEALEPPQRPVRRRAGVYVCGDHRDNASINGAMVSGRRAAEAVLADLGRSGG